MKTQVIERMARVGDADVEPIIAAWAKAGVFDSAGLDAIAASHAQGHAVTIVEMASFLASCPMALNKKSVGYSIVQRISIAAVGFI
jgi:hypothetical protein